ncbi:MAG: hypothetical protein KDC87_18825, partial [Planctomycetes bacterium]|nr:hypothetical protein [Planctomycetota bacterium]
MIENAKSQIALVLILVAASLASLYLKRLKFGLDLAGGTELIYSVDLKDVPKDADIDEFMRTTVSTIRSRIDPDGILESQVLRRGNDGIYVA